MARALFLSLPLHGHTNPSLPLVRELVGRGDDVTYYSTDVFAARIEQAGGRYRPYRNAFLADIRELPERMEQLAWLLMRTTADVLAHELDGFRAERPDYVITDSVAPWGHWVAEVLRVPAVTSVSTFAFNRRVGAFAVAHGVRPKSAGLVLSKIRHIIKALSLGRRVRRQHGVRGPGITGLVIGRSDLNIVYTSRYFQPCAESFDERFHFVGPSIGDRPETAGFPWSDVSSRALVYVSLGTLFNADETFYRNCFEAFGRENVQVVMSIGANVSEARLGQSPPNFIVRTHVPQLEVLRRASVFVTHGGMNSVSESFYNGVPVVVVPQMSEQHIVGKQAEKLGAGVCLAKEAATPNTLRESVNRLLAEDRFRQQAAVVRQSFQAAGGVSRAADAIIAFTRPGRSS